MPGGGVIERGNQRGTEKQSKNKFSTSYRGTTLNVLPEIRSMRVLKTLSVLFLYFFLCLCILCDLCSRFRKNGSSDRIEIWQGDRYGQDASLSEFSEIGVQSFSRNFTLKL